MTSTQTGQNEEEKRGRGRGGRNQAGNWTLKSKLETKRSERRRRRILICLTRAISLPAPVGPDWGRSYPGGWRCRDDKVQMEAVQKRHFSKRSYALAEPASLLRASLCNRSETRIDRSRWRSFLQLSELVCELHACKCLAAPLVARREQRHLARFRCSRSCSCSCSSWTRRLVSTFCSLK